MEKIDIYLSLEDIKLKILSKNNLVEASEILKNDGILAFPTETVYGLGIVADKLENYNRLVKVKNRTPDKPFTLMFSNLNQVSKYLDLDETSRKLIEKFMPGPITLVLKTKDKNEDMNSKKDTVPSYLDLNTGFIGIRMPDDKFVLNLIDKVSKPLLVPSCNKSGDEPCKNTDEVLKVFNNEIEAVIDGECANGIPSTVVKIENGKIKILREGQIKEDEILRSIK